MANGKIFYFGYGSNLLAKRILLNNPTAVRKGAAKLSGYRLDFNGYTQRWGGAVATIVPDKGRHVWGSLWEINTSDIGNLDRQEGVQDGVYMPIVVGIETPIGEILEARTYKYIRDPPPPAPSDTSVSLGHLWKDLPNERRPSPEYKRIIVIGAIETGLPRDYVEALEMIAANDYQGSSGLSVIPLEEFHRTGPMASFAQ
ncbi:gamma-glutamylcyclotransferase-like isoform X2 [Hetaerina americana]|uniref:gamma-glutamylcyclotransferase-like isoform X2 n=1 Tax=Hetaerina americana TaxID=62018 RepID=UPI003A7F4C66